VGRGCDDQSTKRVKKNSVFKGNFQSYENKGKEGSTVGRVVGRMEREKGVPLTPVESQVKRGGKHEYSKVCEARPELSCSQESAPSKPEQKKITGKERLGPGLPG